MSFGYFARISTLADADERSNAQTLLACAGRAINTHLRRRSAMAMAAAQSSAGRCIGAQP
jgi:hypothetical protein